ARSSMATAVIVDRSTGSRSRSHNTVSDALRRRLREGPAGSSWSASGAASWSVMADNPSSGVRLVVIMSSPDGAEEGTKVTRTRGEPNGSSPRERGRSGPVRLRARDRIDGPSVPPPRGWPPRGRRRRRDDVGCARRSPRRERRTRSRPRPPQPDRPPSGRADGARGRTRGRRAPRADRERGGARPRPAGRRRPRAWWAGRTDLPLGAVVAARRSGGRPRRPARPAVVTASSFLFREDRRRAPLERGPPRGAGGTGPATGRPRR